MIQFWLICFALFMPALAFVLRPLFRSTSRKLGYALAAAMPLAAFLMYIKVGDPRVFSATAASSKPQMPPAVRQILEQARNEPENFEAQVRAAELYYQIQRYDDAVTFLMRANRLRPDDFETIANLAALNMQTGKFEASRKWFDMALARQPENITILEGYCVLLLHQRDTNASEAIARLARVDPTNSYLPEFRAQLSEFLKRN